MKRYLPVLLGFGLWAAPLLAQTPQASPSPKPEDQTVKLREEVVVVSASKTETQLVNAPATISVVSAETIETSPAQNYGDLLRSVPGLNVIQTSARDINIVSRQAASTLVNSQLVLLDGRSVYLDFFGLVLWDFLPNNPAEIKQIEVVRGPASVVWGANAMTGVVNVITKTPREMQGFGLNLTGGIINRDGGSRESEGNGYQYGANFSFAHAPSETLSWRLTAGYYQADPFSRPVGIVGNCPLGTPCVPSPVDSRVLTGGAPYPADHSGLGLGAFENDGTKQPKVDLRVDQDFSNGGRMTYQGGYGGSTGIIHTGLGPFDIQSPSYTAYGKLSYSKSALKVTAFGNFTDAKAPNLLLPNPLTLEPLQLNFKTQTYDFEVGNSNVLGGKHILSYGGNIRQNNFDITITPRADNRTEGGVYFQEEFFLEKFRLAVGARADKLGDTSGMKVSPRISAMFKPASSQSIRFSYNRAYRAPSVINEFLELPILSMNVVNLQPLKPFLPPPLQPLVPQPFLLTVRGAGSNIVDYSLEPEHLDAFEVAYTGTIKNRTTLGIAVYQNRTNQNINFTNLLPSAQFPTGLPGLDFYSPTNPATGITVVGQQPIVVSPFIMAAIAQVPPALGGPIRLPFTVFSYLNLGPIQQRGVEVSIDHSFTNALSASANYSYQTIPDVKEPSSGQLVYPNAEVGVPPKNRFNIALNYNSRRYLGNISVNYADKAFWSDVLNEPYFGFTDSYTMLNGTFGVKWADGKVTTSLKGTNLLNETIQQHVFGDIIKLGLVLEVRIFVK
jgi:outer membrane receptor protein involved in Fe transport